MDVNGLSFGRTVVVLGAGATRGASFVDGNTVTHPPLDADFFRQAQNLVGHSTDYDRALSRMLSGATRLVGKNFSLTLEGFITRLQYMMQVADRYKVAGRPATRKFDEIRDATLRVLSTLLHVAVPTGIQCSYHSRLVRTLRQDDTIVSFNYDPLIDRTLAAAAADGFPWNPRVGYGVEVEGGSAAEWVPNQEPDAPSLTLLKMHGSLSWKSYSKHAGLILHPQAAPETTSDYLIVPPEWNKEWGKRTDTDLYTRVWSEARKSIKDAASLVVIGYSLPTTDLPVEALLRIDQTSPKTRKLDYLVIVNPSSDVRRRIRDVLKERMKEQTKVLVFERFEHFSQWLAREDGPPEGGMPNAA